MAVIQITITLDDSGQISVSGPLNNMSLFYGLLEMAKDAARNNAAEQARLVQPAPAGLLLGHN